MKILFVCENYHPLHGGAEVLFKNLAEGYVRRGHQVTVLTHRLRGTLKKEVLGGVVIHRVPSFFSRYAFTFFSMRKAIALARKHDVIQTTTFNGAPPAWVAGRIAKKPVVLTVHEVWQKKWKVITGFSGLQSALHEWLEKAIYLLPYDRYVCVSEATKKDLLKLKSIPPTAVERVYNGLDYDFWSVKNIKAKEVKALRKKLELEKKFVYFSWGRPGASKGFEQVIQAAPSIAREIPQARLLLLFGSVEKYRKRYQQLRRLAQGNPNIIIVPSVPYGQLRTYIAMADCIVVPSLAEGFGYSAVEACALGRPVLVSDAGALPEVVSGKHRVFKNGDPFDLAKNLIALAQGEYIATPLKTFSWDACVQQYVKQYRQLLSRAKKPAE